jgi:hypothetical protein
VDLTITHYFAQTQRSASSSKLIIKGPNKIYQQI